MSISVFQIPTRVFLGMGGDGESPAADKGSGLPTQPPSESESAGGSQGTSSQQAGVGSSPIIISSEKPSNGSVRRLPSRLQVYLSDSLGFQDVCNYLFTVAGEFIVK